MKSRTAISMATAAIAAVALLSLGQEEVGAVSASDPSTGSAPMVGGVEQDEADARAADLAEVGEARGWTNEQVAQYGEAEAALDALAERLSTRYPDSFVGTALPKDPSGRPTAYVKGSAPKDIQELAVKLGVDLLDDQPYSLAENDKRLAEVQDALASAGVTDVAGWADIQNGSEISVVAAGVSRSSLDAAMTGLAPDIAGDVTVNLVPGPVVEDQGAFGGMKLQDGGVFVCTSGWTVEDLSNGVKGITGAGHCEDDWDVDQVTAPGHAVHGATFQGRHEGEWGDVGWYTTTQAEADDFYFNENNGIRDVTGVEPRANISVGESICFYGRASNHRDCSLEVENPNVFCGIGPQKLAQMNGAITQGGDSGGPWYFGNIAFGGHFGVCFSKSSFSVAALFDEALDVTVVKN